MRFYRRKRDSADDLIKRINIELAKVKTKKQIIEDIVNPTHLYNQELVKILMEYPETAKRMTKAIWATHLNSSEISYVCQNYQVAKNIDLTTVTPTVARAVLTAQPKLLKKYNWKNINLVGKEWKTLLRKVPRLRLDLPENIDELLDQQSVVVKLADDRSAARELTN